MKQYLDTAKRLLEQGTWVYNDRTKKRCLTLINADFEYDVGSGNFPLVTTRKSFWKAAISEMLGYLRGYDSAKQFRDIGCNTWNANANENEAWNNNPNRKGVDDMGRVYGVQGRRMTVAPTQQEYDELVSLIDNSRHDEAQRKIRTMRYRGLDQLTKVYDDLKAGIDNRGEIITFWNPTEFELGCLRPCMFMHHFSILDGVLYLHSYQRSCDYALGYVFNAPQCYFLLAVMAQITGLKPGKVFHKVVNLHLYEDQVELMKMQIERKPFDAPKFEMNPNIKTLTDLNTWVTSDDFDVVGYNYHEAIKYPFSV
ncbi:thymidylate synthase [Morganella phage vB_Mm5]